MSQEKEGQERPDKTTHNSPVSHNIAKSFHDPTPEVGVGTLRTLYSIFAFSQAVHPTPSVSRAAASQHLARFDYREAASASA
eukprot:scaffold1108_cov260-Pinguiococcus_pyrenoidosus.AAC.12